MSRNQSIPLSFEQKKQLTIFPIVLGSGNNPTGQFLLLPVISNFLKIRAEGGLLVRLLKDIADAAEEAKGFGKEKMTVNAGEEPQYARVGKHFVSV